MAFSPPIPDIKISLSDLLNEADISHNGWLHKRVDILGKPLPIWKQYYAVLRNGCLYLYKSVKATKPNVAISLFGYHRISSIPPTGETSHVYKFHLVPIQATMKMFTFSVPAESELKLWMKHFKTGLYYANGHRYGERKYSSSSECRRLEEPVPVPDVEMIPRVQSAGIDYDDSKAYEDIDEDKVCSMQQIKAAIHEAKKATGKKTEKMQYEGEKEQLEIHECQDDMQADYEEINDDEVCSTQRIKEAIHEARQTTAERIPLPTRKKTGKKQKGARKHEQEIYELQYDMQAGFQASDQPYSAQISDLDDEQFYEPFELQIPKPASVPSTSPPSLLLANLLVDHPPSAPVLESAHQQPSASAPSAHQQPTTYAPSAQPTTSVPSSLPACPPPSLVQANLLVDHPPSAPVLDSTYKQEIVSALSGQQPTLASSSLLPASTVRDHPSSAPMLDSTQQATQPQGIPPKPTVKKKPLTLPKPQRSRVKVPMHILGERSQPDGSNDTPVTTTCMDGKKGELQDMDFTQFWNNCFLPDCIPNGPAEANRLLTQTSVSGMYLIRRGASEGTFTLCTHLDGANVKYTIVETQTGYTFGDDKIFPKLFDLVEHYRQNDLPHRPHHCLTMAIGEHPSGRELLNALVHSNVQ